jgi:hypothetical protein
MKGIITATSVTLMVSALAYVYFDNKSTVVVSKLDNVDLNNSSDFSDYEILDKKSFRTFYSNACLNPISNDDDITNNCANNLLQITGMFDNSEQFKTVINNFTKYRIDGFKHNYLTIFSDNYNFDGQYVINIMKLTDYAINYCIDGKFLERQLEYYKPEQMRNAMLLNPLFNVYCFSVFSQ